MAQTKREEFLARALRDHLAPYDFVLIDCPPNLGLPTASPKRAGSRPQTSATNASRKSSSQTRASRPWDEVRRPRAVTVGLSVLTGAIGVAGGVLLGRTALQRPRKVLGIPVSRTVDIDLRGVGQRVGDAGRRVGSLAGELRSVREKAEKIGDALT